MTGTKRVVLLARVSRGERSQDVETQVGALQAVAARQGWEVVEVVRAVQSGWDAKAATEVQERALKPIKEGRAEVLMVWALDRLMRTGPAEAFRFIQTLEDHYKASFWSMQEPFLSTAANAATRDLLLPIMSWLARQESDRRSQRLKAKAESKRREAAKLGHRATWGKGKLPTAADEVMVRALRVQGLSLRAIAKEVGLGLATVHRLAVFGSYPPRGDGAPSEAT